MEALLYKWGEELKRAKVREEELEANMELMTQELDDLKLRVVTVEGETRKLNQLIDLKELRGNKNRDLIVQKKRKGSQSLKSSWNTFQ